MKTVGDANAFLSTAGRPNGGLCIDCLHLSRSGGSPSAVASVPVERVHYVQLCDARARLPAREELIVEARGRRAYPGEGELWLKELLGVVPPTVPLSIPELTTGSWAIAFGVFAFGVLAVLWWVNNADSKPSV